MGKTFARTFTVAGLGLALAVPMASGGTAFADPNSDNRVSLTCNGVTYDVVVGGNGEFTPAHDTHSNLVFVPHAFQGFTGTIYDPDGNEVGTFSDPSIQTQGSGKQKNDTVCTYTFSQVSDGSDPEGPPAGYLMVGTGGVTGQIAGHA